MQTVDKFLGGKVLLKQSQRGLRATSDAVLLAAAVPIKKSATLLDVGAGNGVIGLCINARKNCLITALEYQQNLINIIQQNAQFNKAAVEIVKHDLFNPKDPIKGRLFQNVVTNPPFYDSTGKGRKNSEQCLAYQAKFDLKKWLEYCLRHLKSGGYFALIHRPEMLGEILSILNKKLGAIEIFPIQTKLNQAATRIIVRGILGSKTPLKLHPPLIMHNPDGSSSETAENILRKGQSI